jgi:hypothetical protein
MYTCWHCATQDLKFYGFNPILEKFVAEVKSLQTVGFEMNVPILGLTTVYASLGQITCDYLALNGMLGFIESFSSEFFCTIFYVTQDEVQKFFRSDFFKCRTIADYDTDVSKISHAQKSGKNHYHGVKGDCVVNKIDGYHVIDNWSLDIMHIVLEGIVPVEIGCILYGLCVKNKLMSLDTVNNQVHLFWGQLTVNKCDKPSALNRLLEPGHGLAP